MAVMLYKAMDERGRISTGRMEAANAADLELRLERLGLDLINYSEGRQGSRATAGTHVKRRDLITFTLQLEQLLSSGVPVLDALSDLRDSMEERHLREVLAGMVESIEGGKNLSAAMEEYPHCFDAVYVNLVRAGEFSGRVGDVLKRITETLKWQDEQASQVRKILVYPSFVGTVVMLVVVFLMTYLVPQLVTFIKNMGQTLPWHTRLLIAVSHFFVKWWYLVIISPVAIGMGTLVMMNVSPAFRYWLDDMKLRVWVFGPIVKKIILARFANYFALLYSSGITVLDCVRVCEGLVGNRAVAEATRRAGRQIADGASISAGFESTGLFPPLVLRMLRVGENTGALDAALMNISYFYNRDVEESMERMQAMIGPTMTLLLGAVLGWVILSVLGPIYDLISKVKT